MATDDKKALRRVSTLLPEPDVIDNPGHSPRLGIADHPTNRPSPHHAPHYPGLGGFCAGDEAARRGWWEEADRPSLRKEQKHSREFPTARGKTAIETADEHGCVGIRKVKEVIFGGWTA